MGILTDIKQMEKTNKFLSLPSLGSFFSSLMFSEEENNFNLNSSINTYLLPQMLGSYENKKGFLQWLVNEMIQFVPWSGRGGS